ncbi:hypothetical protein SEA_SKOG_49 [Gordonia phage Skog]|uniref:Uncharacterized protein n=1 Tax=Gordonia phage Skog TaxID=2704033 RepID=A0A6G6XJB6_9CAUD|nr:hypothetical protein KHQ85_gp049 [Gordonia phage Skog]QIG58201.1 hypothetical protein SEA_SKOG_49 [Gordonia phage Skog]
MGWLKRIMCSHVNQRGIYGDLINLTGGKRSVCMDCGKLLRTLPPQGNPPKRENEQRPQTGLDRVREAIDRDRGGPTPPPPAQGWA